MKEAEINNDNDIYINPRRFIKLINDKCLEKLGRKGINNIYYSPNKKVVVEFADGVVVNYDCYRSAFEHLNVAYNLKLVINNKRQKPQLMQIDEENISAIDIVKYKIEALINNFKNLKNVRLNNISLEDYFDSYEWKKNNFSKSEIDELISHLEKWQDKESKKYVTLVKKIISRG